MIADNADELSDVQQKASANRFNVLRTSRCHSPPKRRILAPRTDIDMVDQFFRRDFSVAAVKLNEIALENALHVPDYGIGQRDRFVMLTQLVHEARRYQKEQLAKFGVDIDQCAFIVDDSAEQQCPTILNTENTSSILQGMREELCNEPSVVGNDPKTHSRDAYALVQAELAKLLLFMPLEIHQKDDFAA